MYLSCCLGLCNPLLIGENSVPVFVILGHKGLFIANLKIHKDDDAVLAAYPLLISEEINHPAVPQC
jgi:hypothetical protein